MKKSILSWRVLMVLSFLLLVINSCREEINAFGTEDSTSVSSQYKIKRITEQDFDKLTAANTRLEEFKTKLGQSAQGKNSENDSLYNFSIVTEHISEVDKQSIISYTFEVKRDVPLDGVALENLLMFPAEDSYGFALVQYHLTEDELGRYFSGEKVDFTDKISITELEKDKIVFNKLIPCQTTKYLYMPFDPYAPPIYVINPDGTYYQITTGTWTTVTEMGYCEDGALGYGEGGSTIPTQGNQGLGPQEYLLGNKLLNLMYPITTDVPTNERKTWIRNNEAFRDMLINYYYERGQQSAEALLFCRWLSDFTYTNRSSLTLEQIDSWFLYGYSQKFYNNIQKLSPNELLQYIDINDEIEKSPYTEEYVKETNEAFAAFGAYADIDNMTDAQIEYVLNNNCCAGLFLQQWTKEKVKLIAANYKLLRKLYPSWSKGKAFWYAGRETLHLLLDIAGTVPVIGEVCDITNGAIYTIEGDALNASLSYAGAIPIAGWGATGAKFAIKTLAGGISLAIVKNADGFYVVSRNQQLFRKVLGMVKGDVRIAHHIIPFALQTNPVIQKAMLSKNSFMINEALNGIPLSTAVHSGSHTNYTKLVKDRLDAIPSNYNPDQVYSEVIKIIDKIKTAIQNNPNTPINQLNF